MEFALKAKAKLQGYEIDFTYEGKEIKK